MTTRRADLVQALVGLRVLRGPVFKSVQLLAPALFVELAVAAPPSPPTRLWLVFGQFVLYLGFAYAVNDLADRDADRSAGKQRTLAALRPATGLAVTTGLGLATLAAATALRPPPLYWLWLTAGLALAVAYSVPPLWLKRRGALGVVAGPLLGKTVPLLLCCSLWQRWGWWAAVIGVADLVKNAVDLVFHQLVDEAADRQAGVRSYVVVVGRARATRTLRWLTACGIVAALAMAGLAAWGIPELRWPLAVGPLLLAPGWLAARRGAPATDPASPHTLLPLPYVLIGGGVFLLGPAALACVLAWRAPAHTPLAALVMVLCALQVRFYVAYRYR